MAFHRRVHSVEIVLYSTVQLERYGQRLSNWTTDNGAIPERLVISPTDAIHSLLRAHRNATRSERPIDSLCQECRCDATDGAHLFDSRESPG